MRLAAVLFALVVVASERAEACPGQTFEDVNTDASPAPSACLTNVDFGVVHRVLQLGYAVGVGGLARSGVGGDATAFAGIDLGYAVQFGEAYEIGVGAGATVTQVGDATGLVTNARGSIGPARVAASVVDEGKGNIAFFPLTMELAHAGELAARPRLSARPELARSNYGRERVELATRLIRVEGAGEKAQTGAPGSVEVKKPTAWALDVFPLHGGVDIAMQDVTRFESVVGGAMLGVVEHTSGASVEVLGLESRRVDLPMGEARSLETLWVLRVDGVNAYTGTRYFMGWGEAISTFDNGALAEALADPEEEDPTLTIGGIGWFSERAWGGFGMQYKREPFMDMAGDVAIEDRVSGEVYLSKRVGLVGKAFAARTSRLVEGALQHESTAGFEIDATYAGDGFSSKVGLELGRTFYTAMDDTMPETAGFAASVGLTVQHAGQKTWRK